MKKDKEQGSVILSIYQIKEAALKKKGVTTLKCFELHYDEWCLGQNYSCYSASHKAWTGKEMPYDYAENIADFLETNVGKLLPGSKRNTSTKLSSIKARRVLAGRGIFTLKDFEISFDAWHGKNPDGAECGTPRKVWKDIKIAKTQAKNMASFLGVSVQELQPDSKSPWETLIYSPERQEENFMTFHVKDPGQLGLAVFDHDGDSDNEELHQYKVRVKWHLSLKGESDDLYFIVLRSDSQFDVLAPVSYDDHSNKNAGTTLRYPQNKRMFSFDKQEGLGFRELIAIRIPKSISTSFYERTDKTTHTINISELNSLANSLMLDQSLEGKMAVAIHSFILL